MALASVLAGGALVIQLPQVQTTIAQKVVSSLSDRLDGDISFEKIHFKPFTTLVLKNTLIIDKNPVISQTEPSKEQVDTFFRAEYIIVKLSLEGLLDRESIKIDRVYIDNAQMNLVLEDYPYPDSLTKAYNNLSRIFRITKPEVKPTPKPEEIFRIRQVEIADMGFAMKNYSSNPTPWYGGRGINWNDLDIKDIHLHAENLSFKDGIMYGEAESLSFNEKSGFICHAISGKARVGRGRTIVEDLRIKDEWSDLDIPLFMMTYDSVESFTDFISQVRLDGDIAQSTLDFRTIIHFAPQLEGNKLKATISGRMSGYVDDFMVSDIMVASQAGGFSGRVNGRITGIPDTKAMRIDAKVGRMKLSAEGLGRFISEWMPEGELDFSGIGKGIIFNAEASAEGLLDDLNARASLNSEIGSAGADVKLKNILDQSRPISISGTINTDNLDIGRFIGSNIIGPATVSAGADLEINEGISIDLDSLNVHKFNLKGYDYHDIRARGHYDSHSLNGTVISRDPNMNFIFQGGYARSDKSQNTVYKFNANIGHADLNAINIDRRGTSIVQLRTNANFTRTGNGNILGRIDVGDIMLENKGGRYEIGDIIMTSLSADNNYTTRLNSRFADASFTGTSSVVDFFKDLKGLTVDRELPALASDSLYVWKGQTYNLNFVCHDLQNVLAFAAPGLYIENGTSLKASIDKDGVLDASVRSGRIAVRRNYLKDISARIDNRDKALNGEITLGEISAATIVMSDNILQLHADDNHIGAGFSFDNHNENEAKGEFIVHGDISREEESRIFDIKIMPSSLQYGTKEWNIQPSDIRIHDRNISIDSFGAVSGEESISLHGHASDAEGESLTLSLERFDLSVISSLLPEDFGVRGAVTGHATIDSPVSDRNITIDMLCDSSYIANVPLGVMRIGTAWNEEGRRFDFFANNELNSQRNLSVEGSFSPQTKSIIANAGLDRLDVGYAQPFLKDIFSEMKGFISGNLTVQGPLERLSVKSNGTRLDSTMLRIAYTGVPYFADGGFHIDQTGVYFDDISVKDRYNGSGTVSGSINYDHFRDINFNTKIKVDQIEGINLTESEGDVFYGNIYGSGLVEITGPVKALVMNIDASTAKSGNLHIPISSTLTSAKGTNLLKFIQVDNVEHIDPYDIFVRNTVTEDTENSKFIVRLKVNANQNTEAFVEIDKASGNVLSGRGNGIISLEAGEDIFNINGDYTIDSGNYKFEAIGLVSRDFQIQQGSTIRFGGDIMDSSLDINAIYRTKASLSTLISDTTSVADRRIVDCGISIKDKISNPQLSFSIEIPDLDPTVKSRVESALSSEDKVQKQFLSLILSNSFLPDEQSGIVNNSSVLYSNVTEMMANQINNIFQKLDIPLDLGLKYQPNDKGNDIFDVAVSTQLFNNRVIVNGNIGNKQYSSGNTQNEVVGDIDIEIKLNRSGSFRLSLFSHSADQYTNFLDNSQRNGVGVTYQTEFNTFRQFFKNLFSSKAKRREARIAEEEARLSEKRVTIQIKKND